MTDDIVTRLRQAYKDADEVAGVFLANEAADKIEQLITQLRIQAEVVNGKDYHTISGGLHLDAADEIERLRAIIRDIANAVTDEGRKPGYHKQQVNYVRTMWNPLWQAISKAVKEVRGD